MITTIILSKDRPAQLDLLLRSIERNGGGQFVVNVIARSTSDSYYAGYQDLGRNLYHHSPTTMAPPEQTFPTALEYILQQAGEFVCFMCDDGILYQKLPTRALWAFEDEDAEHLLCMSLRLGDNTTVCYPTGEPSKLRGWRLGRYPFVAWDWQEYPPDFGYPGSIDGHIFRTTDVRRMLEGRSFPNPTALECALVEGCNELAAERPLMACYPHSVYVGNPINRVSEQSGVRYGATYPVTAEECNQRFLAGERIDLEALDFSHVNGAHTEIELKWH